MGQRIVTPVTLAGDDADGICVSQTVPAAGTLAISGALSTGASANNVCTSQSAAGAADLTLNGSLVTSGVAYLFGQAVQIISAADDSDITFTVYGIGPDGLSSQVQTVTGANTSRVATSALFHSISRIATSAATSGNVTVGTNGTADIATNGTARQVIVTSGGDDTGVTFTVTGTNAGGFPLVETFAGANGVASSVNYFNTVTKVTASAASASTVLVGTNTVGSGAWVSLSTLMTPSNVVASVVVSGTVNYTVQYTYDDLQSVSTVWDDPVLTSETTNGETTYSFPITGLRCKVNSGTGTATMTTIQAGVRGN
jgi:hypothetical protein